MAQSAFPLTDETAGAGGGRYSDFSNNATIDCRPKTGAQVVTGENQTRWLATGREGGASGYPTSDAMAVAGRRRSSFGSARSR